MALPICCIFPHYPDLRYALKYRCTYIRKFPGRVRVARDRVQGAPQQLHRTLWLDTDIDIKISDVYLPDLQELLNGDKSAEEVMKDVQAAAAAVRAEAAKQ